ncbi:hypothetical protein REPUB_Repub03eG0203100 [Reevesia pubescens]
MDESLRKVARGGDIIELYASIQRERHVLRQIDEMEFVDTPLHIAAAEGCIDFAMEVMNLKPSFARKLNQEGFTPIHLAVEKGNKELVLLLMENDKDLIHVKGKKGETPLHFSIAKEHNLDLLARFLEACPECIRDVTTTNQTALHIATENNKLEDLKLLCGMLRKTEYCQDVVNQKDRNGDTALHIAARNNQTEMLKLLLKCKADKHVTNQAGSTALEVAEKLNNRETVNLLRGWPNEGVSRFKYKLQKQFVKCVTMASAIIFYDMDNIMSEDRNALLVILGLLLTATYQASLSPPGSVLQGGSPDSNSSVGKSVMNEVDFLFFYIPACAVFIVTFFLTLGLLKPYPRGFRTALQVLLAFLATSFEQSISVIAPTQLTSLVINIFSVLVFLLMMFMCIAYRVSRISVLFLGCWLFRGLLGPFELGSYLIMGCWVYFSLYDPFWIGAVLILVCISVLYVYLHSFWIAVLGSISLLFLVLYLFRIEMLQ